MKQLLIGCGSRRERINGTVWSDLTTLDINPDHKPDIEWDLTRLPLPFDPNEFDEIHAYEVLEHTGQQGDFHFFCDQFEEFWRILKPGGLIVATTPSRTSPWLWGDPSHTRVIQPETLVFLSQEEYTKQVGKTPMSDFRHWYKADFKVEVSHDDGTSFMFVLRAVKPSRISI